MLPKLLLAAFALAASASATLSPRQDGEDGHDNTRPGKGFDAPTADLEDLYSVLAGAAPEFSQSVDVTRRELAARADIALENRASCPALCLNRYCVPKGSQCCGGNQYCPPGYQCNKYRKGGGCCKTGDRVCTASGACLPSGYLCCGSGVMPAGARCCGDVWCPSSASCAPNRKCLYRRKGRDFFEDATALDLEKRDAFGAPFETAE
ncbi:uncharacterized protein LOC62_02G003401 [Vanrija pseudolonga]|uniref:Granulins domain-containing protein n=1 Tax=Vanrija pseudolonga TaxID=143232 RepID=A0AAF1BPV6_9TREE|nr:hypothetical protein LOC62_02G003401 [Vanrija pseudolonga]